MQPFLIFDVLFPSLSQRSRWILVSGFIKMLLPWAWFEGIQDPLLTFWHAGQDGPFAKMFKDCANLT
jgi:hypothetical protein